MTLRRRLLLAAVAATGLLLCALAAPHYLRRLEAFRVRDVEISGLRYMEPAQALAATGIGAESSVFDDPASWRAALLEHPLVDDAWIGRRPPRTLSIEVREAEPVALIRTPTLRPVGRRGQLLPVDPAGDVLDLPILAGSPKLEDGRIRDPHTLDALRGLDALRTLQPSLWAWTSEFQVGPGDLRLILRWPADAELLLPLPIDSTRLEEVRLVLADLAASGAASGGADLARLRRLDARFGEQVVVSLSTAKPRAGS